MPKPDQCFEHYQITAPLGAGGMGEVFLAPDTRLLKVDPIWDSLRSEPRFIAVLKKTGLDK